MDLNRRTAGILVALLTGVRIGELCGLQMQDISLEGKTINIIKKLYTDNPMHYFLTGKNKRPNRERIANSSHASSNGMVCKR